MIALKALTMPRLRMFAVAAMAAATFGVAAVPSASATSNTDYLPTRKQVCYLDPVKGKGLSVGMRKHGGFDPATTKVTLRLTG